MKNIGFSTALAVSFAFASHGLMAQGPPQIEDFDVVEYATPRNTSVNDIHAALDGDTATYYTVNPEHMPMYIVAEFSDNTSVEEIELRFRGTTGVLAVHDFRVYAGDDPEFDLVEDPFESFTYTTYQEFQKFTFSEPITSKYLRFHAVTWGAGPTYQLTNIAFYGYEDKTSFPTTYGAAQQIVGDTGVSPYVITNNGDAPVTVNGVDASGLHSTFSLTNLPTFPHQIPAGETLEFDIVFQPTEPGFFEGEMLIDYTGPVGQVIAPVEVRSNGVNYAFGYVPIRSAFASSQISAAYPPTNAASGRGMFDPNFVVGLPTSLHGNLGNTNWLTDPNEVGALENAFFEMDFEEDVALDRMLVWNFNQGSATWNKRGMKDVRIEYRALADGDWTLLEDTSFTMTPNVERHGPTDVVDFTGVTASRVRISSRGGLGVGNFFDPGETNASAPACGLAEVRFYAAGATEMAYDVHAYEFGSVSAPVRQSLDLALTATNGPITVTSVSDDLDPIFSLGEVDLPLVIDAGTSETLTLSLLASADDFGLYEGSVSLVATDGVGENLIQIPVVAEITSYAPGFVVGASSSSNEVALDAPQFYDAVHLTNDNGLTEVPATLRGSQDALAISGVPTEHWWSGNSGDFPYVIDFDLGKVVDVNDIAIWNFNRDPGWVARGTAEMNVLYRASETDSWTTAHNAYELDQATGQNDDPRSNLVPMSGAEARYVRFEVLRSFADLDWVGMGKVRFYAEPYFSIDQLSVDLGSVSFGGSESVDLTITNTGHSDLEIEDAYFLNSWIPFTVSSTEGFPLIVPAGETVVLTVTLEEASKSTVVQDYEDEILRIVYTDVNRGSTDVLVSGSIEVEDTEVQDWLQF